MPEVKLSLGGTVDIASSAEVKSLDDKLSGLQGHLDRHRYVGKSKPIRKPFTVATKQVGIQFGSMTVSTISEPDKTPAVGRLWILRSAFVYNALDALTSGLSGINCALAIGNPVDPSPNHLTGWTFQGVPMATTFGTTAIHVNPNEVPYIVIGEAVSAGANFCFNFEVDEYSSCDFEAQSLR